MNKKIVVEMIWYIILIVPVLVLMKERFHFNYSPLSIFFMTIIGYVVSSAVVAKYETWSIRRKIRREIIKGIKAKGFDPKDFDIEIESMRVLTDSKTDSDVVELKYKDSKKKK